MVIDDVTPEDLVGPDAAVVATLWGGEAAGREAVGPAVLVIRVLLLDAEDGLVLGVLLRHPYTGGASVRDVWLAVDREHLAEHELVLVAADRVGADENRLQHAVALVARRLVR